MALKPSLKYKLNYDLLNRFSFNYIEVIIKSNQSQEE